MSIDVGLAKFLTIAQAAGALGVSKVTLRRWERIGLVKAYRVGPRRDRRYAPEHIAKMLRDASRGAGPD